MRTKCRPQKWVRPTAKKPKIDISRCRIGNWGKGAVSTAPFLLARIRLAYFRKDRHPHPPIPVPHPVWTRPHGLACPPFPSARTCPAYGRPRPQMPLQAALCAAPFPSMSCRFLPRLIASQMGFSKDRSTGSNRPFPKAAACHAQLRHRSSLAKILAKREFFRLPAKSCRIAPDDAKSGPPPCAQMRAFRISLGRWA